MATKVKAVSPQMIQIQHRYSGVVLFECEAPEGLESGLAMRYALEKAVVAKADLSSANLRSADLRYADLRYADLSSANLSSADLRSADLSSANLRSADLSSADLRYANLSSANLRSADLSSANLSSADLSNGKKLSGDRPFFSIGPIGSRSDYIQAFITDVGLIIRAGCFFDTRDKFELALTAEHGDNEHGREYLAALVLIDKHAELWAPKAEAQEEAEVTP